MPALPIEDTVARPRLTAGALAPQPNCAGRPLYVTSTGHSQTAPRVPLPEYGRDEALACCGSRRERADPQCLRLAPFVHAISFARILL